jgi:hypothetical protein
MLWNPALHYHTDHSPSTVPILSQTNPVHAVPAYTFMSIFSIILTSMHRSSKWSLSSVFFYQNSTVTILLSHVTAALPVFEITILYTY